MNVQVEPEEIKETLEQHSDRLQKLEVDNAVIKEQLATVFNKQNSLELAFNRVENTVLTMTNSILTTVSSAFSNKENNNTKIILKVIGGIVTIGVAVFAGSKIPF